MRCAVPVLGDAMQGKLCWVLQWLAVLLGVRGTSLRLVNAQTLQVRGSSTTV